MICSLLLVLLIRNYLFILHYNTIKKLITYFFILNTFFSYSQNVTIKGRAHKSYSNKIIQLYKFQDFITNYQLLESTDTIKNDGFFELQMHCEYTQPVILKIQNIESKLYVQPNFVYGVTIPEIESSLDYNNGGKLELNLNIIGTDTTELNHLIIDYQETQANALTQKNDAFIGKSNITKILDSLFVKCNQRYQKINNTYFKNYYLYQIAELNTAISRGENYLFDYYIKNKPIQYQNFEYMSFFTTYFKGYIQALSSKKKGQSLHNIINKQANWTTLNNFLKSDDKLTNDSIRELVTVFNLLDFYYSSEFNADAIEALFSQINNESKINLIKTISQNILVQLKKMQAGNPAPVFKAKNKNGEFESITNFKNKWVYLNFFSTKNENSLREMYKINELNKKYNGKVVFISVCVDDSIKNYQNFIKKNPKFNWPIWFNYDKELTQTAKDIYSVIGTEAYYLINNSGYLAQSPATSPSNGIEYKFNLIFKIKTKTTKIGIR